MIRETAEFVREGSAKGASLRMAFVPKTIVRAIIAYVVLTFAVFELAVGQHHHATAPRKPASLMTGLGNVYHTVSTRNAEAQQFFNQGLALVYAFNHDEALRSFQRAAELDPQLAMAYWGMALAIGPNYNEAVVDSGRVKTAWEASEKARSLAGAAPEIERGYIAALGKRFSTDPQPDYKRLALAYRDAMRDLHYRFPDDLDAATLYADSLMNVRPWQLWTKDGRPAEGTDEIVAVLEEVLRRDPNHIGANHLYIHAVEASTSPHRALPSAARLEKLAPEAGHLVHMPAHVYIRTGDHEAAARSNEQAAAVDRAYIQRTGARGIYPAMYYNHNLHFLVEAYGRTGQLGEATRAAQQLAESAKAHVKEMPMIEFFLPYSYFALLRFAQWDQVLRMPAPEGELLITRAMWHYARGVAFAATGKTHQAKQEQKLFDDTVKTIPAETPYDLNSAAEVLQVAARVLDARIAWAAGDRAKAIESWRGAVVAQDALNYAEPPDWYYPVRESLAAALFLVGDAAGAEKIFREDLKNNPRNGRSLFGLLQSLKEQGKQDAARWVEGEFKAAWKKAEVQLRMKDL